MKKIFLMDAVVLKFAGNSADFIMENNLPDPVPGKSDILVQIKATAFNPIDYQMRHGKTEIKRMHSPILGREFSGIVIKTGSSVKRFREGDAVFAASGSMGSNGTYASYISVPYLIAAKIPKEISFEEAAAIPIVYLTAFQAFNRLLIKKNDSFFISGGAGGVGAAFIKLLLAAGHSRIVTTAGNADSKQQLVNAGLQEQQIIDYKQDNPGRLILSANADRQFDHAIDTVGGKMSEICAEVINTNGNYADITALSSDAAREQLFNKGAVIVNISNYAYSLSGNLSYYGNSLNKISKLLENGEIKPPPVSIIGNLSVETVIKPHDLLENNQSKGRKLVMLVYAQD